MTAHLVLPGLLHPVLVSSRLVSSRTVQLVLVINAKKPELELHYVGHNASMAQKHSYLRSNVTHIIPTTTSPEMK
jgi:hypothetical protein